MRSFRPNWKIALFTAVFLPLMLALGFWQLDREQQKIEMQQRYEERMLQSPLEVSEIDWQSDELAWTRITAVGEYDNARQFLMDNSIHESSVGYEVITPLHTDDGLLLVNRGWIAQGASRADLPELESIPGAHQITGTIFQPDGSLMVLSAAQEQSAGEWPYVLQRLDMPRMEALLGDDSVLPLIVRLEDGQPGRLGGAWPAINTSPHTHRGYAVQWFVMSAVLLMLFLYTSFKDMES